MRADVCTLTGQVKGDEKAHGRPTGQECARDRGRQPARASSRKQLDVQLVGMGLTMDGFGDISIGSVVDFDFDFSSKWDDVVEMAKAHKEKCVLASSRYLL